VPKKFFFFLDFYLDNADIYDMLRETEEKEND
jgi:hypothetical protein